VCERSEEVRMAVTCEGWGLEGEHAVESCPDGSTVETWFNGFGGIDSMCETTKDGINTITKFSAQGLPSEQFTVSASKTGIRTKFRENGTKESVTQTNPADGSWTKIVYDSEGIKVVRKLVCTGERDYDGNEVISVLEYPKRK
jgi:hypothetical protein